MFKKFFLLSILTIASFCFVEMTANAETKNEIGTITSKSAKVYEKASSKSKSKRVDDSFINRSFYVREAKKVGKTTYYRIEKGASNVGWVDGKFMKRTPRTLLSTSKKTMYILGTKAASTMPAQTSQNESYNLEIRRSKSFETNRFERVGDEYWYKGKIAGTSKNRWIQSTNITDNAYVSVNLRKPSNVSAKDLQALMLSKGRGPDNVLYRLAPEFIKAQSSTGVNAQFMFAHAVLETGWGGSTIAQYKNNLFGYQAYDTCPITCSKYFPTGEDGLKLYAEKVVNNYLTPSGAYHNGMTVLDMNVRYASDKEWGQKIASIMIQAKPYDAKYYNRVKPSTKRVVAATNFGSEIPANKPQPGNMVQLPADVTAIVSTDVANVTQIPYVYGIRYGFYNKGQTITLKGYHTDVREMTNASGKKSRWYRIDFNGKQGWVRSDQVAATNLAFTNKDAVMHENPGSKYKQVGNAVKNTPIKLVLNKGKAVTKKDGDKKVWYQVYKPNTTNKMWMRSDVITQFN